MNQSAAIVIMLLSCASYALSYVLQHRGTQAAIGAGTGGGVMSLMTNPIWIAGVLLFGASFGLHLTALAFGSVSVVQPLIVTELIFIPPFAAIISHAKIHARDWLGIFAVATGLAIFLIIAKPQEGTKEPTMVLWIATIAVFVALMLLLMQIGNRLSINHKAAMYGMAAGIINALLALLAKGMFDAANIWTSWLTYATVVCAVATVGTTALAFRSGPITTSSPAMIAINPIISAFGAILLFGETFSGGVIGWIIICICFVAVAWGVLTLTKSEAVHAALGEPPEEAITDAVAERERHGHGLPASGPVDSAETTREP